MANNKQVKEYAAAEKFGNAMPMTKTRMAKEFESMFTDYFTSVLLSFVYSIFYTSIYKIDSYKIPMK